MKTNFFGRCASLAFGILLISLTACKPPTAATPERETEGPSIQAQKAVTGVGKQGQSLKDNEGIAKVISGPAAALINFKQKAVFEIQIPQALNLFQGLEGRLPKSHQEFMEKIVTANRIQLPELPAGAVYRFNTEKGELWVYPEDEAP